MDVKKLFPQAEKLLTRLGDVVSRRLGLAFCHLFLALTLAQGSLFTGLAPFGVAFVAAASALSPPVKYVRIPRLNAIAALVGASVGYAANDASDGLKYICAALLCYAAGSIFAEAKVMRTAAFMPMMAVFSIVATNAIYLIAGTADAMDVLLFFVETILTGAAAWFYRFPISLLPCPFPPPSEDTDDHVEASLGKWTLMTEKRAVPFTLFEKASIFVLLASVCAAVSAWQLPFGMNAGRVAALFLVLTMSAADAGLASAAGLCLGLALDLSGDFLPLNAACLGLAGLFASLFRRFGTLGRTIAFVIGYAVTLPWLYTETFHAGYLYESFLVSVLYYLFASHVDPLVTRLLMPEVPLLIPDAEKEPVSRTGEADAGYLRQKLALLSNAFRNLCDTLVPGVEETGAGDDPSLMFESAAMRVCKRCDRAHVCWNGSDSITRTALNDATDAIRKRGRAVSADFPPYFAARCIRFPEFLTAVNEAIAVAAYRKRFRRRVYDDVRLLCAQYEGMSGVLRDVTADLGDAPHVDRRLSARLTEELRTMYDKGDFTVTALRGQAGRLRIDIETADPTTLNTLLPDVLPVIDHITDRHMTVFGTRAVGADITCLTLTQKEAYHARIGIGLRSRQGETKSGDTCVHFKTDGGTLYLIISDGMGSGADAAAVSASAASLLEGFLRSGVSVETALRLICPAFALKHEADTFTTIDLLAIDLHTGDGVFYKCGAAPSFILSAESDAQLRRVTSGALPAGVFVGDAMSADKTSVTLHDGDTVVMVSDGVLDGDGVKDRDGVKDSGSGAALLRLLSDSRADTPSALASKVLDTCDGADDATVFVVRLEKVL